MPFVPLVFIGEEVVTLVARSGPVVKFVLLILLAFSVFSWAIIFAKWRAFRRSGVQSERFLRAFRRSRNFSEMDAISEQFRPSPLVAVFEYGYNEMRNQVSTSGQLLPGGVRAVQRALQIGASEQLSGMERMLGWLATTGSVTPFIGLFGTVWGIMGAFHGLSTAGAASLRSVAPGISEALVATAAGLFVAIPAVVAYNHFLHNLREFGARMDNFNLEFLNLTERNLASAVNTADQLSL